MQALRQRIKVAQLAQRDVAQGGAGGFGGFDHEGLHQ
jgi:hypothetical protein